MRVKSKISSEKTLNKLILLKLSRRVNNWYFTGFKIVAFIFKSFLLHIKKHVLTVIIYYLQI